VVDTSGIPRRVSAKGREGTAATVAITTYRGQVWMSIMPPFTWEAIMEPKAVNELIHALTLARDEATQPIIAMRLEPSRKAIEEKDRQS
jgi:hypothetical protein